MWPPSTSREVHKPYLEACACHVSKKYDKKIKASSAKEMAEQTTNLNMFFTIKQVTPPVLKDNS